MKEAGEWMNLKGYTSVDTLIRDDVARARARDRPEFYPFTASRSAAPRRFDLRADVTRKN
jgi:hypothetical protein